MHSSNFNQEAGLRQLPIFNVYKHTMYPIDMHAILYWTDILLYKVYEKCMNTSCKLL